MSELLTGTAWIRVKPDTRQCCESGCDKPAYGCITWLLPDGDFCPEHFMRHLKEDKDE